MSIILLIVLFICFVGIKFIPKGFYKDYIDKEQTNSINGIFILLIFLSHSTGYLVLDGTGPINDLYLDVRYFLSQLVVVTFLFYSGYGVMISISKKGVEYVKKFPVNRILKVLMMFDIAVLCYLVLGLAIGTKFTISQVLLSLIGYKNLGNSNWYIFTILLMYVVTYIIFLVVRKRYIIGVVLVFAAVAGYVYIGLKTNLPSCYWNTAVMYPVGMLYALCRKGVEKIVMKNNVFYTLAFALAFVIFIWGYAHRVDGVEQYTVHCIEFMAMIVLFTMKVKLVNPFILWLGENLFSFYIMQRFPMTFFVNVYPQQVNAHPYLFVITSFVIAIAVTTAFNKLLEILPITGRKRSNTNDLQNT